MIGWRPRKYQSEGEQRHVDPAILDRARLTAESITHVNPALPPIFTLRHLAHITDIDFGLLRAIASRELIDPYRLFKIRKRSAGAVSFREICVPNPELMRVQRWINQRILSLGTPHAASKAYTRHTSIMDAADPHCSARWLIKLDIENFFNSISEISVYYVFRRFGYQPLISLELARLCTRIGESSKVRDSSSPERYTKIPRYNCARIGYLPQGAPTSPMLANLAVIKLDEQLDTLSSTLGLTYTRYADDLTFSTDEKSFLRGDAEGAVKYLHKCIRNFGLSPKLAKTRIVAPGSRKVVLGLLVNTDRPRLSRAFKNKMRQHFYYLEKHDAVEHAKRRGFVSVAGLRNHLVGLIAFASQIEPDYGNELLERLMRITWPL